MLYGQNLPWRAALLASRTGAARTPRGAQLLSVLTRPAAGSRPAAQRVAAWPLPLRSASAPFSTSLARRKEKPRDDGDDEAPVKDEGKTKADEVVEDAIEGKAKAPENPTPIPPAQSGASTGGEFSSGGGGGDGRRGRKGSSERSLQKPSVPDVYPQVMAIPIAKRPLFPGFYKAITIRDPGRYVGHPGDDEARPAVHRRLPLQGRERRPGRHREDGRRAPRRRLRANHQRLPCARRGE